MLFEELKVVFFIAVLIFLALRLVAMYILRKY